MRGREVGSSKHPEPPLNPLMNRIKIEEESNTLKYSRSCNVSENSQKIKNLTALLCINELSYKCNFIQIQ